MSKEEFKNKYTDTHTALECSDLVRSGDGSLVKHKEKGIVTNNGSTYIIGKRGIEAQAMAKRQEALQHMLLDATACRAEEALEIPYDKLVSLTIKAMPQRVDQKVDMSVNSFASLWDTVDAETVDSYEELTLPPPPKVGRGD